MVLNEALNKHHFITLRWYQSCDATKVNSWINHADIANEVIRIFNGVYEPQIQPQIIDFN